MSGMEALLHNVEWPQPLKGELERHRGRCLQDDEPLAVVPVHSLNALASGSAASSELAGLAAAAASED